MLILQDCRASLSYALLVVILLCYFKCVVRVLHYLISISRLNSKSPSNYVFGYFKVNYIIQEQSEPLAKTHFVAEGEVSFKSILFIPASSPSGMFQDYGQKKTDFIKVGWSLHAWSAHAVTCINFLSSFAPTRIKVDPGSTSLGSSKLRIESVSMKYTILR